MEKITLLVNTDKTIDFDLLKQKTASWEVSSELEFLFISYHKQKFDSKYTVLSIEEQDDLSFTQVLDKITTERFLFFNFDINYPADFVSQLIQTDDSSTFTKKGSLWEESLVAVQQSHYGLCSSTSEAQKDYSYLKESVLFLKKEVKSLNTDKMNVHAEMAIELYRYARKKNLNLSLYTPPKKKIEYLLNFADLLRACSKLAQRKFKLFPAIFTLFFTIFGIGAAFSDRFLIVFLLGMGAYMLAITLESFGLSTTKKNGALLLLLIFLFPFIHLIYGLESWISKFKSKA